MFECSIYKVCVPKDVCVYSVQCKPSLGIYVTCFSIFRIILLETGMEDITEYSCVVLQVLKVHFFCISMMLFQVRSAFLTRRQTLIPSQPRHSYMIETVLWH